MHKSIARQSAVYLIDSKYPGYVESGINQTAGTSARRCAILYCTTPLNQNLPNQSHKLGDVCAEWAQAAISLIQERSPFSSSISSVSTSAAKRIRALWTFKRYSASWNSVYMWLANFQKSQKIWVGKYFNFFKENLAQFKRHKLLLEINPVWFANFGVKTVYIVE